MEAERELRRRAEELLRDQRRATASIADEESVIFQLDLHRIELELQNAELRHLDAELLSSRERYQEMFEQTPVAMLLLDPDGVILELNLAAARELGGDRWRLVGRKLVAFVTQRDADPVREQLGLLRPDGATAELTVELRDREGRDHGARLFARRGAAGVLVVLVPTATGEADRRRWLDAQALHHVAVPVLGADTYGRIEVANAAAERLLGYAAGELEGQPLSMVTRAADLSVAGPHVAVGKHDAAIAIDASVETWWEGGERHRTITLQASPASPAAPGPAPRSPAPAAADHARAPVVRRTVLVIAGHVATRVAIAALLQESGLDVFLASAPDDARLVVNRLARDAIPIDAVVSEPEEVLPGTLELVRQLRRERPGLEIALVAGLGVEVTPPADLDGAILRLPFDTQRLLAFIDGLHGKSAR